MLAVVLGAALIAVLDIFIVNVAIPLSRVRCMPASPRSNWSSLAIPWPMRFCS